MCKEPTRTESSENTEQVYGCVCVYVLTVHIHTFIWTLISYVVYSNKKSTKQHSELKKK